ncbi:hypothetical protein EDC04DRAFT_3145835 [Pisolithus marmoratus]|nr:hypothetical protein EDC04DRAFT_3145835 [Pisolithus marmoratus]
MFLQAFLRIFTRFPKLFNAIAKRCSTVLHLLRYLFCWNPLDQKWKRTHLLENGTKKDLASTTSSANGARVTKVEDDGGIRPATILCSEVAGVGGSVLHHTQTISRSATSTSAAIPRPEPDDLDGQFKLLNTASDVELRPYTPCPRARVQPKPSSFSVGNFSSQLLCILVVGLEMVPTFFFLNGSLSIMRSVRAMQDGQQTDIDKFRTFWAEFQKRLHAVILLATVLLTANIAFLAIQSVDQKGLSYLPQKCSYISIMVNLGCIAGGFALRMPRVLKNGTLFHLDTIALILGFPSTLFLYGVFFFFFALVFHIGNSGAGLWLYWTFASSAIFWFMYAGLYLVITEPLEKRLYSSSLDVAHGDEGALRIQETLWGLSVVLSWNK